MVKKEKINTRKILVVDDDDRNLRIAEAMLIPLNYTVMVARDGIEALEKVKESPPDVILLDIMMPKMNGLEVARILKADPLTSIIPIVMVTALKDVEDRVKALEAGADDFLSKPIDSVELRARVSSLIKVKAYNDHMVDYQEELETEVTKRTAQLEQAYKSIKKASLETIYRLSRAAEYRDEDTGSHLQRISQYAAIIARQIDLGENKVEELIYATPMHDVGKIGIPDAILLKPGRLDNDEWAIIKQHPVIGYQILKDSDSELIKLASTIALTHHEKWDGSGYPNGLAGENIPLVGRITAIIDVFDALTSKRPYKEPFSIEKALCIIKEGRGNHFDPLVVDSFLESKDKILSIREKYKGEE